MVEALFWTMLAANQGLERAQETRKRLLEKMGPDEIAAAETRAADWKPTSD